LKANASNRFFNSERVASARTLVITARRTS
jgi:hypothetical protein